MSSIVKPYLFRAALIGSIILVLGIALSIIVYFSTEKVRDNAIELVERRIPTLTSINQIISDLSEQERIVYEYYATQNIDTFLKDYQENSTILSMHLDALFAVELFQEQKQVLLTTKLNIDDLVRDFDIAMQKQENNWDEIREILSLISDARKQVLPTLLALETQTQSKVDEGHLSTLAQMKTTHLMVICYGIVIVLFALVGAWYIRQYILTNAKNTRLALFSQQNPNPILSVNNLGEVVYSNPASSALLKKVGLDARDHSQLLPSDFLNIRQNLAQREDGRMSFEQDFHQRILQINVNWLKTIDAYDIHIIDITDRKLAEQEVNQLAFYVKETKLPNQYKLEMDLGAAILDEKPLAIGLFEVKQYAETASAVGVQTAESIVRSYAAEVAKLLPKGVGLYQVNESLFALVWFGEHEVKQLEQLAQKILSISETSINTDCGEFFIDVDVGFSCYPHHGKTPEKLIQNALTALSMSASDEHNHVMFYTESLSEQVQKNKNIIDKLRYAVEQNELFLVFQPQLALESGKVEGVETLVRWQHQGEIVSPVDFIPLAEQSGLIVPIGQWILENACQFAKKLIEQGHPNVVVAVNVSPRQFSHPDFYQTVVNTLASTDLPAKNLELEITEGVFMHNESQMLGLLAQLKTLGLQLSIDDFGTGYSSLSYLKRFPVDKLKIDQSFIRECHNNDEDKAIVNTIVTLGKSLGLSLIAEGVEEQTHVEFLKQIGCEEIQGYWYSRPLKPDDLLAFLTSESTQEVSA